MIFTKIQSGLIISAMAVYIYIYIYIYYIILYWKVYLTDGLTELFGCLTTTCDSMCVMKPINISGRSMIRTITWDLIGQKCDLLKK